MFGFFKDVWNGGVGNKVMLVAGALIFVLAVVGVCYGVFTG